MNVNTAKKDKEEKKKTKKKKKKKQKNKWGASRTDRCYGEEKVTPVLKEKKQLVHGKRVRRKSKGRSKRTNKGKGWRSWEKAGMNERT